MAAQYKVIPIPARPENPTGMEMAIYNFEKKCAEFHNAERAADVSKMTPKQQLEHAIAQDKDWQHLNNLKAALIAHTIQDLDNKSLDEYRDAARNQLLPEDLEKEKHHPPAKLEKFLAAIGELKPSHHHAAHHIIMGKGSYQQLEMQQARFNMHQHGIGINDPMNGVWLVHTRKEKDTWNIGDKNGDPKKPRHWATPDSPVHLPIHTYNYETWIIDHFGRGKIPRQFFIQRLKIIKTQLKNGTYPSKIEEKPDKQWSGV